MRRILIALTALLLGAVLCSGQTPFVHNYTEAEVKALLQENPGRVSCPLHAYEVPAIKDTQPPRGYKPFYVSHFGRHGCRYHGSASTYVKSLGYLQKLDSLGQLTAKGKRMIEELKFMQEMQSGMDGMLTQKGGSTHRGIASRLAARYPELFSQKGRNHVRAVSSTSQRCIMSMSNFIVGLEDKTSGLDISMDTGPKYMDYIAHSGAGGPGGKRGREIRDSVFIALFDPGRMSSLLLKDPAALQATFPGKEYDFYKSLFFSYEIGQCLDYDAPDLFSRLTVDELYAYWADWNIGSANNMGRTVENEGYICRVAGGPLLGDILNKAQEAIDGGKVCADLRFGHDTGIVPLLFLIRVDGFNETFTMLESLHKWMGFYGTPMAANVQFVFFRNKRGTVLVKVLVNEQERTFPGLETVNGVYYEWPVLREYLEAIYENRPLKIPIRTHQK